MPVTPFHFGPGALVAAVSSRAVSFLAFCAVNVVIDVESLYNMLTSQQRIHTVLHTYIGATFAAFAVAAAFVPAQWAALRLPPWPVLSWRQLPMSAVVLGAVLGAWSHVLLDSIMHGDITPLAPFSDSNGLFLIVSLRTLHVGCLVSGVLGVAWYLLRRRSARPIR